MPSPKHDVLFHIRISCSNTTLCSDISSEPISNTALSLTLTLALIQTLPYPRAMLRPKLTPSVPKPSPDTMLTVALSTPGSILAFALS